MVETSDSDIIALLNEYGPIVKHIAKSACYSSATIDFSDLCQVGDLAVLQAIKTYNPSSGTTIKSYVSRIVRNEIYREAARFLGVFTVDFRITPLAAKVHKLHIKGHTDSEIAGMLKGVNNCHLDIENVRDLRITYSRKDQELIEDENFSIKDTNLEERSIHDLLSEIISGNVEKTILENRILGTISVQQTADSLNITKNKVYEIENILKERIKRMIEGMTV